MYVELWGYWMIRYWLSANKILMFFSAEVWCSRKLLTFVLDNSLFVVKLWLCFVPSSWKSAYQQFLQQIALSVEKSASMLTSTPSIDSDVIARFTLLTNLLDSPIMISFWCWNFFFQYRTSLLIRYICCSLFSGATPPFWCGNGSGTFSFMYRTSVFIRLRCSSLPSDVLPYLNFLVIYIILLFSD